MPASPGPSGSAKLPQLLGLWSLALAMSAALTAAGQRWHDPLPMRGDLILVLLLAPALAAGWLLAFTLSLDDLVVASFVSGPGATTLPMLVFASVRLGLSPQINALATLMLVAVAVALLAARLALRRGGRGA